MHKFNPIHLSVIALLVLSLACVLPSVPVTPDQNAIETAIVQTMSVALTQTFQPVIPITNGGTPTFTFTAEPPTLSPTVTLTPTPLFTPTPVVPLISVSVATNCRVGPGRVYPRVGALLVGELAEVLGRDPTGAYWYIRNPDSGAEFCWLWGEYATLTGNFAALPMFTPPPTPTPAPAFEATYSDLDTCTGWWVDIDLENTGGLNFRSFALTVRDMDSDVTLSLYRDGFTDNDGCLDSTTRDNLEPGSTRTISSPPFAYDPNGHRLRATITLCSNTGQSGTCVTDVITFEP